MAKKTKVLVVEDSPTQAAIIAEVVRQAGMDPAVYTDLPTSILQILSREQPQLVLLDLRLLDSKGQPMADGFQLCREIKRSPTKPPVIVISAEGDEDACEWAIMQGADAFLQKPFSLQDLTEVIEQVLAERSRP